jgi:hypothetical protein
MPKQKDLKRLTRARMEKTGESYTAARAHLVARAARRTAGAPAEPAAPAEPPPPAAPDPADYAALAGTSEETIAARTGCGWKKWVDALDYKGAAAWSHTEIAAYVHETFGISGWWAQTVTTGYERIKGLREIGQRRGGDFEGSKSKTLAVPLDRVRHAFADADERARWLAGARPTPRKTTSPSSLRFTWEDGTAVDVWLVEKGPAKTQVTIAHRKLTSKADADERKAWWGERLAALAAHLAGDSAA